MDFIMNGKATGDVAGRLMQNNFDPGVLRPFIGNDDRSYMTVNVGGTLRNMVCNADATLRKEDWKTLDLAVVKAAQPRLKAFADLRAAGLTYAIPNGMAKTVLETETQSDISDASVSMDGLAEGANDRPVFELGNLPLPIIHKDFNYSARQILASRNGGSPLDTTHAELAGRKVAEMVEKLTIGTAGSYKFGGGYVYGYTNFPSRITKSITTPTTINQAVTLAEVLDMKKRAHDAHHYGPYMMYCSPAWDPFMDGDYSASGASSQTLRERLARINGIDGVETLDYLTGYDLLLIQKTTDVARAVIGMDIKTVQWESKGGMQLNFKVMAILVPQLRADHNSNTGIIHGSV